MKPDFITKNGRRIPLTGRGGGGGRSAVAAAALVLGVTGVVGGGVAGGGAAGSATGGSAGGSSVTARKLDGQKAAKRGDRDGAWQRMGLRKRAERLHRQVECLSASHGEVREFFTHTPCTSLDRMVIAVEDDTNTAVISVAWVGFRTTRDLRAFKRIEDEHGTGDIHPLGAPLLGLADITFTGHNYGTKTTGTTLTIAEVEPVSGNLDGATLDALAEVAAYLPRP
ncbi:MAG: hypothetical protein HOV94_25090 [Saccharothrix sp.]|nr:hypothetical protein [Saccharothrix sp.]